MRERPPFVGVGHQTVHAHVHRLDTGVVLQGQAVQHHVTRTLWGHVEHDVFWRHGNPKVRHEVRVACQRQRQQRVADVVDGHVSRNHLPIQETHAVRFFRFENDRHFREVPSVERRHGRGDVHGVDFHFALAHDVDCQVDLLDVVAVFHAADHFVLATAVDEVTQLLELILPSGHGASPSVELTGHLRFNDRDHAVEDRVHVGARKGGVAQVSPTVDVGVPERLVAQQRVEHRNVALTTEVAHAFGVAWIGRGTGVRHPGVVHIVPKTGVHVPQRVAPALGVSVRMTAAPPRRVPVEPVGRDDVAVQDEVVDERQRVELGDGVVVVRGVGHVLRGAEVDEIVPIVSGAVLFPCASPRLQEIHKMPWLVVILLGEIDVVHLLTVLVHPPVLAVEVHDATLVGALVEFQIRQVTQGVHVRISDVCPWFKRVVVVGSCLENQALVLVPGFDVEHLGFQSVIVPHLVAGDVVETTLSIGVAVVAMLVAVSSCLDPKRAVGVEELDVGAFPVAPAPGAILLPVAADRHHGNGVRVGPQEVGVGRDVARRLARRHVVVWIERHRPNHRRLSDVDGARVQRASFRGRVTVEGVVDVEVARHRQRHRKRTRMVTRLHVKRGRRGIPGVHVEGVCAVGPARRGRHTHFPAGAAVHISGPTVVCLGGAEFRAVGVGLQDVLRRIRKHQRLSLALVDLEVGVEETAHVQIGRQLSFR